MDRAPLSPPLPPSKRSPRQASLPPPPIGLRRWLLATRPAFLTITLLAVAVGFAGAWHAGAALDLPTAVLVLTGALTAHAGANVINDVWDARSGCDGANHERLAPFTGGSRFIQDGHLSEAAMAALGSLLLLVTALCGVFLLLRVGSGLLLFGLGGLLLAWGYSAPPLRLMHRGLGEQAVGLAWTAIVAGSDYALRREASLAPWLAGMGFGLLVIAILYANQFPDWRADAAVGKRNWVVRLGRPRAARAYAALPLLAGASLGLAVAQDALPPTALLAFAALVPSLLAARELRRHAETPAHQLPALRLTLVAAHAWALLLLAGYVLAHLFGSR